jgi:uncharacterized membrane protein YhaH (DUF805 family)
MDPNQNQTTTPSLVAQPVTTTQPTKSIFSRLYGGRLNRKSFIIGVLIVLAIPLGCYIIFMITNIISPSPLGLPPIDPETGKAIVVPPNPVANMVRAILVWIMMISTLLQFPFGLSLSVRRMHDLNKSGWLYLLTLVPLVNIFIPFYLLFFPGSTGENKYGPQPLQKVDIKHDILKLS